MSLTVALLLAGAAGLMGIAIGYFLRLLLTLGKKGSVELEVKQMLLEAKEEAQKITEEAEKKGVSIIEEARKEEKEKQLEHLRKKF